MGALSLGLLAGAVGCAIMRARHEEGARSHRTVETDGGQKRIFAVPLEARYTAEGKMHLRKARVYRTLFLLTGLGAVLATWRGW